MMPLPRSLVTTVASVTNLQRPVSPIMSRPNRSSCSDTDAHAMIVTKVSGSSVYITCHSTDRNNYLWTNYQGSFSYFDWLRNPAA